MGYIRAKKSSVLLAKERGVNMFVPQRNYDEFQNKTFRLPTTLLKRLEKIANVNNISTNKLIIQALEYALDNLDENAL